MFDSKGASCFIRENIYYILALLNSVVTSEYLKVLCPTLDFNPGQVAKMPVNIQKEKAELVLKLPKENVSLSRTDWDSYETSWDFKRHPMLCRGKIADAYTSWKADCESRFLQLKANEEELNRIFIDIYGLQDELTPDVADKDVTVHRVFDTKDDVPESMKGSNYIRTIATD